MDRDLRDLKNGVELALWNAYRSKSSGTICVDLDGLKLAGWNGDEWF